MTDSVLIADFHPNADDDTKPQHRIVWHYYPSTGKHIVSGYNGIEVPPSNHIPRHLSKEFDNYESAYLCFKDNMVDLFGFE